MDVVSHLAWPLRYSRNGYAAVQQDTVAELSVNVAVICSFPLDFRDEAPEFGIPDPDFQQRPLDLTSLYAAVDAYEPRARVNVHELPFDPVDPTAARVRLEVAMPGGEDEPMSTEV